MALGRAQDKENIGIEGQLGRQRCGQFGIAIVIEGHQLDSRLPTARIPRLQTQFDGMEDGIAVGSRGSLEGGDQADLDDTGRIPIETSDCNTRHNQER